MKPTHSCMTPSTTPEIFSKMEALTAAWEAVTVGVADAGAALQRLMIERGVKRLTLNGEVSYVGESGDFHAAYIAVAIDFDGNLIAVDDCECDMDFRSLDNEVAFSVLNCAVNSDTNRKLLGLA